MRGACGSPRGAYLHVSDPRNLQRRQRRTTYIRVSLCRAKTYTVKTRRYKQDAKGADLPQGAYLEVRDQGKTQARQCIATYIRVSSD